MPPSIATIVYVLAIAGLFVLNRDPKARTSKALWIPVVWFLIVGSRDVSLWLSAFGIGGGGTYLDVSEQYLEGNPIDRAVFTGLLVLGLIVLVGRGQRVMSILRTNMPIVMFFLYAGMSTLWSDYPGVAMKRWIKALGDVVMVMVVLTDTDRLAAIKRLLARVAFLLIPVSVLLIKYYPDIGAGYNIHHWTRVLVGVTTHKNFLGVICLIFGLGCEWRFLAAYQARKGKQRTRQLIAHGALLVMVLWLLLSANSMTSLACFLLAGGLLAATRLRVVARRPSAVHLLVAAVVLVSFSTLFLGVGGSALETMGRDASLTGRTGIWNLTLSLSGNPLIGTGYESFWLGKRLATVWITMEGIQEAHNGYLEVFLNLGWIGVTLLATVMVTGYRNVLAEFRRDPDVGRLKLAYFVVGVVYNFTEAGFRMLNPIWSMFLLATMAVPKARVAARPSLGSEKEDAKGEPQIEHEVCVELHRGDDVPQCTVDVSPVGAGGPPDPLL
jgi:O-antigen ligase